MINIELPYPPTVNHYYRHVGYKTLISKDGRNYRKTVCVAMMIAKVKTMTGPVALTIDVYPPDRRRRDLDNLLKSLIDSLEHGGAFKDDSQIVKITATKHEPTKGGKAIVRIEGGV